jgi:opacity protein-like surface antigen
MTWLTWRPARHVPGLLAVVLLAAAAPAAAQAPAEAQPGPPSKPYSLQVTGGAVVPLGEAADASGLGWNVGAAAEVALRGPVRLRVEGLYSRFAAKEIDVPVEKEGPQPLALASMRGKMQSVTVFFDAVVGRPSKDGRRTAYLLAGPLVSQRRVQITGSGDGTFEACLPQWFQCSSEPVPFDRALGIRRATSIGASVGAGMSFEVGLRARLVIEARYAYHDGPSFTAADGTKQSASASYIPITVGLRF